MTRKQWNAGVVIVVLTMLLIMVPEFQSRAGTTDTSEGPANSNPSKVSYATVHQVDWPEAGDNSLTIHVASLQGVLSSRGNAQRPARLILMNSRISDALAGTTPVGHPLLSQVEVVASGLSQQADGQILLSLAEGVVMHTEHTDGGTRVVLERGADQFTIHVRETPYAETRTLSAEGAHTLKTHLAELAQIQEGTEQDAWWPASNNRAMKDMLREVRDAEVRLASTTEVALAAQEENDVAGSEPVEPAVEEAEPVDAPSAPAEATPPPPAPREAPEVTTDSEAQKALAGAFRTASDETEPMPEPVKPYRGDPLKRPVSIDWPEVELYIVVQYLAEMAGINVVANHDLGDPVDLYLENVPLMQAMETALRLNGLGIVEEEGIYYIRTYEEAIEADRTTELVELEFAEPSDIVTTLKDMISRSVYESYISITANKNASTVIISGPEDEVAPLVRMAKRLDVEQAVLPTVTMPIKLNYANPDDMIGVITPILTKENDIGQVQVDQRARILVVTDIPIVVEKVTELVKQLDIPAKSVAIEGLIVDVTLTDAADTGVDWLISAVQSQSRRDAAGNTGIFTGNLQELSMGSNLSIGDAAGLLNFGILSGDIDWRGVIQAEVRNNNSTLLSNPKLITVENQPATILIASEIPYVELTQTEQGGQQTSTEFKPIGTELTVTPKVTHDDFIIAEILAKESTTTQEVNGIPVEDKREIQTTPHIASGQTIYVGGLRKNNDTVNIRKVPVLGDVPVMNFLFRSNQRSETVNELLIFLTCTVLDTTNRELSTYQQERLEQIRDVRVEVNAQNSLIHDAVYPSEMRDPAWKWRKQHKRHTTGD